MNKIVDSKSHPKAPFQSIWTIFSKVITHFVVSFFVEIINLVQRLENLLLENEANHEHC